MHPTSIPEAPFEAIQRHLRIERAQTADELAAFEQFTEQVRDVSTGRVASAAGPATLADRFAEGDLRTIREAYRSTVMEVDHYDQEYGNDYIDDVAEEFGSSIATALQEGGPLDNRMKQTLLVLASDSMARRQSLLTVIDAEKDSVKKAAEHLESIIDELEAIVSVEFEAESFGALDGYRARTDVLSERCDAAVARRQCDLRSHRSTLALSGTVAAVPLYLYQDFEDRYPVLSFIATLGERIEDIRLEIGRAVSHYEDNRYSGFPGSTDIRGWTES